MKLTTFKVLLAAALAFISIQQVSALAEGIYCGLDNCYDVLGVTRESSEREIIRSYRKLAKIHHPDLARTKEAREESQKVFLKIAAAYEVLKENDSRKDYDYMLDNPEEMYRHYWQYYRRKVRVDVRLVAIVAISLISLVQYYAAWSKYNEAIDYFLSVPKYRFKAQEIAKAEGLLQSSNSALKRKNRQKTKEQVKRDEELVLRSIIEDQMDIKGAYQKPTYYDILWVQLAMLPYTLYLWVSWYVRWYVKYSLYKEEYTEEDKYYIIRKNMKLSQGQWDQLDVEEKEDYLRQQLWKKEKYDEYHKHVEAEKKAKLAESSSHKRYRRWVKKGGPGNLSFMDD